MTDELLSIHFYHFWQWQVLQRIVHLTVHVFEINWHYEHGFPLSCIIKGIVLEVVDERIYKLQFAHTCLFIK